MKIALRLCALALLSLSAAAQQPPQYDVLIRNGRVVDGAGNPWFYADVGITGDRIAFVGRADAQIKAKREFDVKGLIVAPGFIDVLGQSELALLIDKRGVSKLTQGITTEITGEGESAAPANDKVIEPLQDFLTHYKLKVDWTTIDEYLRRLERDGSAINLGTMVGAAQVRRIAIGTDDREPTKDELALMQEMVGDAMGDGAFGLSTSLIYAPGFYAKTDELIALAKAAAQSGGIYATHIRNEGDQEMSALEEAFRIGREANIPVEIWHLKASGRQNWGKMRQVIAAIEDARKQGVDVAADVYPYIAGATSLGATIPPRFHDGGTARLIERLKDPAQRQAIRDELLKKDNNFENWWRGVGGPNGILVISVLGPQLKRYEGRTVAQIANMEGKEPVDALLDLVIADNNNTGAIYFSMNEEDLRYAMQQPFVSFNNDASATAPDGPLSDTKTHPRAYGAMPRVLGKYVREEGVLKLEDAIRKMTSLPAQRFKIADRGLLQAGKFADITIFDPESVLDRATFENPAQLSVGIRYVFVNGVLALESGKTTGEMGGRPLRGPGYLARAQFPDGLAPKGKLQVFITGEGGWPLLRAKAMLLDSAGKEVASAPMPKDGFIEFTLDQPCKGCTLRAERQGFTPQEVKVNYNGQNSLWFGFTLKRLGPRADVLYPEKYPLAAVSNIRIVHR